MIKRPCDVPGDAVQIAHVATGEIENDSAMLTKPKSNKVKSGIAGATARNRNLLSEWQSRIIRKAS